MLRQVRLVLVTATIVALLAVAAAILERAPIEEAAGDIIVKAVEPFDIRQVLISNEHGTIDISFTGEGYLVDDIPADQVDMQDFLGLMMSCGKVSAMQVVAKAPSDLAAYGLSEPAAVVAITYNDDSALTLRIGDVERVTGETYFSIEGDPAVYLMATERTTSFLLPKKAYVEDLVTPVLALSSPLSALLDVVFAGGQLAEPVTVEAVATKEPEVVRAAMSFGTATHIVRSKGGVYELDQTYAVEMMGALLGITANDIEGYGLTQEQILAFGFDNPTMQVAFDLKNGIDVDVEHYDLAILEKDGTFYMTCNDRGIIYAVPDLPFMKLEYSKLLVRWFLSPLLIDVSTIEIVTEGETFEFVITGESNAEKQVTCNDKPLDIDRFRTLFGLLRSAAHDARLLENAVVEGEPLLRLTYHYLDAAKQPDVMELFPGDTRRVYVRVNGVTELAMQETYLARVQEALGILWTDKSIETNW